MARTAAIIILVTLIAQPVLTTTPEEAEAAATRGSFGPLVELLRSWSDVDVQAQAAKALWKLAWKDAKNKRKIAEAGAIDLLVALARFVGYEPKEPAAQKAAGALAALAFGKADNKVKIGIGQLMEQLRSRSDRMKVQVARALWILAFNHEMKVQLVDAGGIELLVDLLRSESEHGVKEKVAWALLLLAMDTADNPRRIAGAGAREPLTTLARSGSDWAKTWATQTLTLLDTEIEEGPRQKEEL